MYGVYTHVALQSQFPSWSGSSFASKGSAGLNVAQVQPKLGRESVPRFCESGRQEVVFVLQEPPVAASIHWTSILSLEEKQSVKLY